MKTLYEMVNGLNVVYCENGFLMGGNERMNYKLNDIQHKKIDSTGGLLPRSVIGWYSLLAMGDNGLYVVYCENGFLMGGNERMNYKLNDIQHKKIDVFFVANTKYQRMMNVS